MTAQTPTPPPYRPPTEAPASTAPSEHALGPSEHAPEPSDHAPEPSDRSAAGPSDAVESSDDAGWPVRGTAAGVGYVALPPTAVDARPNGPTRLIVAWPGFDPPRTAAAMAAALPMTGVPTWRVYLDLPHSDASADGLDLLPTGLDSQGFLTDAGVMAFGTAVERAAVLLPAVLADLRRDLGVPADPVALAGFSAGAAVVLLALARQDVRVSTAAVVAPVVAPARVARSVEKRSGRERSWGPAGAALADRLDLSRRADRIADSGAALLLIGGARDRIVPGTQVTALRDRLARCGAPAVEAAAFRMSHALAAAPGTEARPPITEAVRVDGVLTDWFRERLAEPASRPAPPVSLHLTGSSS
ncbi:hypothetical protein DZF91_31290 [Actinomadura logoneensis]|uniref:Peptidase S9 prolyl oligopeptidase catalytic domain-containing protein n=1 Tax=Actinomadura logoneensis TaxID=2293572 RepID=A0A372JCK5_9ACTN|nr:hypothetical protein [Actinomadura logoneensis]RFU37743.1 hypothetical protein DZF91_31290 [Actinomadura logoneensis]